MNAYTYETRAGFYDAAIITAVNVETDGVRHIFGEWRRALVGDDGQEYFETEFVNGGRVLHLVMAQQHEMGMTAAAALTVKLINAFEPKYILMPGIAAGICDDSIYGDVLIPDVVWNYSNGKYVTVTENGEARVSFMPRPKALYLDGDIKSIVRRMADNHETEVHIITGPMACGSAVVSNSKVVDELVRKQFPDTVGLDMESYAVFYAAQNSGKNAKPIVMKSICDYANDEKSDLYQKFAAYTSAECAKEMLEKFLPF